MSRSRRSYRALKAALHETGRMLAERTDQLRAVRRENAQLKQTIGILQARNGDLSETVHEMKARELYDA